MGARGIVKVCGVTSPEAAERCVALGVDWIGVNFVPSSPRRVDVATARAIAEAARGRVEIVGVVANLAEGDLLDLQRAAKLDRLQLHGSEPAALVTRLGASAFKAIRVGSIADVAHARTFPGLLLVDAKADGQLGGTGKAIDLALVRDLVRERPVLVAGGLSPKNVAAAVGALQPFGVDVASGVERAPGDKDWAAVEAFVTAARGAFV